MTEVLRTPESRFEDLPGFDYEVGYVDVSGGTEGIGADELRMAYVDEGDEDADETFLCLHGEPTWSYLYRRMIPGLADAGRVVVPDLVGFGRSDKPVDEEDYTFASMYTSLETFVRELDLTGVTLVCQDWGGILGLHAAARHPGRFSRLVPMNTGLPDGTQEMSDEWHRFRDFVEGADDLPVGYMIDMGCYSDVPDGVQEAYDAPFPSPEYLAGARALPLLVPLSPDDDGADRMRETREALSDWDKPAFVLYSSDDPITRPARDLMRDLLPTAGDQPDVWIDDAAHFLQEDKGAEIADRIVEFVGRT